ncbi:MAG TPA: ABC transporter permease, partial [Thermoanaerobaculia bacterium]|nr:ABC transporter permease [Thermoanaerobaculia bacterium]
MDTLLQDLRFAVRQLLKSPGFTAIAAATLALGIGANTAIVSLVSGTLLAPLPYQDPDRLVRVAHRTAEQGVADASFSREDFADLAAGARGLAQIGSWFYTPKQSGVSLTGDGEPERLEGAYVSAGFFPTLGVPAAVGRTLAAAENVPGSDRVVVLSDRFWRRRFGADPALVGRTVTLDGQPSVVAGVMPASFTFPDAGVDLWLPVSQIGEDDIPHLRGLRWMGAVARLAPGVTPEAAEAEANGLFRRLAAAYPETNEGYERAAVIPLHEAVMGEVRRPLMVLLAGVALVLVVACANLANL